MDLFNYVMRNGGRGKRKNDYGIGRDIKKNWIQFQSNKCNIIYVHILRERKVVRLDFTVSIDFLV
jgi:hypothetical protein